MTRINWSFNLVSATFASLQQLAAVAARYRETLTLYLAQSLAAIEERTLS
jgi:hypothetical protein